MRQSNCKIKSKKRHESSKMVCKSNNCGNLSANFSITATPKIYTKSGDVITFTYIINNTGKECISFPITIYDNLLGKLEFPYIDIPTNKSESFFVNYTITDSDSKQLSITNIAYAIIRVSKCNLIYSNPASTTINLQLEQVPPSALIATLMYNGKNSTFKVTGIPPGLTDSNINISPTEGNTINIINGDVVGTITGTPNATITIKSLEFTITVNLNTTNTTVSLLITGIPEYLININNITLSGGTITKIEPGNIVTITAIIPIVNNSINATLVIPYSF